MANSVKNTKVNRIKVCALEPTDKDTLQGFIQWRVKDGAKVYTDDHTSFQNMRGFDHESVKHSIGEYVKKLAHTSGVESFWACSSSPTTAFST